MVAHDKREQFPWYEYLPEFSPNPLQWPSVAIHPPLLLPSEAHSAAIHNVHLYFRNKNIYKCQLDTIVRVITIKIHIARKNHNRHFLSHNTTPNLKTKIIKLHCPAQKFWHSTGTDSKTWTWIVPAIKPVPWSSLCLELRNSQDLYSLLGYITFTWTVAKDSRSGSMTWQPEVNLM